MKKRLAISLLVVLAGCSKVTQENYDALEAGMSFTQVTDIMGAPDLCEEKFGTNSCRWGELDDKFIKVNFIADKAVFFEKQGLNDN